MSEQITTTTADAGSVTDQIANLLMGEQPTNKEVNVRPVDDEPEQDLEAADTLPDESNDEGEEETDEAEASDEPVTWASTLGVDERNVVLDDDGNFIGFNTKVDGKVSTVSVKDLLVGFQNNKSNTLKSQELAEHRKEFDANKSLFVQEYTQKLESVDKLTQHLKNSLVGEYQNIDWNRLRVENPGEYAAAVQDFNMRNAEIEKVLAVVNEEKAGVQNKMTAEQQADFNRYIKGQAEKIIENNPAWAKPEVFKKAVVEMSDFVNEAYGFSDQEFKNVQDARMLEVIKDAMKYRQSIKAAKTKLDVNIPKMVKSKGAAPKAQTKLEQLTKKAQTTQGYHKRAAETDAVAELLRNLN
jgi:hypothetical protein